MFSHDLLLLIHILPFCYWPEGDIGVFYLSQLVVDGTRSRELVMHTVLFRKYFYHCFTHIVAAHQSTKCLWRCRQTKRHILTYFQLAIQNIGQTSCYKFVATRFEIVNN